MSTFTGMFPYNLTIYLVEKKYTEIYIAEVFHSQHIAQVKSISLIKQNSRYNIAIVEINKWYSNVIASNFIARLQKKPEARLVHHGDNYWNVSINLRPKVTFQVEYFKSVKYCDDTITESTAHCSVDDSDNVVCPLVTRICPY